MFFVTPKEKWFLLGGLAWTQGSLRNRLLSKISIYVMTLNVVKYYFCFTFYFIGAEVDFHRNPLGLIILCTGVDILVLNCSATQQVMIVYLFKINNNLHVFLSPLHCASSGRHPLAYSTYSPNNVFTLLLPLFQIAPHSLFFLCPCS